MKILFIKIGSILLTLIIPFFCITAIANAQSASIAPLINAWKVSDTNQTRAAEKTYANLNNPKYRSQFLKQREILSNWIKKHPDPRLEARIVMYDILGRYCFHIPIHKNDRTAIEKAIANARQLKDRQIEAEIYTLYANFDFIGPAHFLTCNLKALALQKQIGIRHFYFMQSRFFNVSYALYHADDFSESIIYGIEGLKLKKKAAHWDPMIYIFQLDMVGASYLHLSKLNDAIFYYQKLINTLKEEPLDNEFQNLWLAIAQGNIGHALLLQKKEALGTPLVKKSFDYFTRTNNENNLAIFGNVLAETDFVNHRYLSAINKWKQALISARKSSSKTQEIISFKGISKGYKQIGIPDSVYKYDSLYYAKFVERQRHLNETRLSNLQAKITLENTQLYLENSNKSLNKEKLLRNFILSVIALIAIIVWLLYNKQRIKNKYRARLLETQRWHAEKEVEDAKNQIQTFVGSIREKEKLIAELKKAIDISQASPQYNSIINDSLTSYSLLTDGEWKKFKDAFKKSQPLFFPQLLEIVPHINPAEERLASLLYLQLDNSQIAGMLGIGTASVARSKRRLKQRLSLGANDKLEDFIFTLGNITNSK